MEKRRFRIRLSNPVGSRRSRELVRRESWQSAPCSCFAGTKSQALGMSLASMAPTTTLQQQQLMLLLLLVKHALEPYVLPLVGWRWWCSTSAASRTSHGDMHKSRSEPFRLGTACRSEASLPGVCSLISTKGLSMRSIYSNWSMRSTSLLLHLRRSRPMGCRLGCT